MTVNPLTIGPDVPVNEARILMENKHIRQLPVVDKAGRVVGIVTRQDLLRASPSPATTLDMYEISYLLSKIKVDTVMARKVITIDENEVVEEAARIITDNSINSLPVMHNGNLVGIVTGRDLLRVFINAFGGRSPGVRFTLTLNERPGQLAHLASGLAAKGGNIVSFISMVADDPTRSRETCKVTNVTRADVETVVASVEDAILEDIRE
jgi:acetoin utilization protein AcuB